VILPFLVPTKHSTLLLPGERALNRDRPISDTSKKDERKIYWCFDEYLRRHTAGRKTFGKDSIGNKCLFDFQNARQEETYSLALRPCI